MERLECGRGDRVLLVHGSIDDARATWVAQRPLAESYRLVLLNRRGFGNSPDAAGEDYEVDADDLVQVLREGPAHVVGHSYGGVGVLLAAARLPESVRSLTVFEPPAFSLVAERPDVQRLVAELVEIWSAGMTPDQFLRRFLTVFGGDPSRLPTPLTPSLTKATHLLMQARPPWTAWIPIEQLARTTFPKLVISGGHNSCLDAVCDALEARLPALRKVFRGAGHSIPGLGGPVNDFLATFWRSTS